MLILLITTAFAAGVYVGARGERHRCMIIVARNVDTDRPNPAASALVEIDPAAFARFKTKRNEEWGI